MKTTMLTLGDLLSDEFAAEFGIASSPRGLRRALYKSERAQLLRRAISSGAILENDIRRFAEKLMRDFERGVKFPHELALAALAIAMENRRTDFVEEFLLDLARLNIAEMSLVPGVARDSMRHLRQVPRTRVQRVRKAWKQEQEITVNRFTNISKKCVNVTNRSLRRSFTDATS